MQLYTFVNEKTAYGLSMGLVWVRYGPSGATLRAFRRRGKVRTRRVTDYAAGTA